jgi:hypothetical protein
MSAADRQARWQNVYTTKGENEVGWFQERPSISLQFIESARGGLDAAIVDIGGGLPAPWMRCSKPAIATTVLDLSEARLPLHENTGPTQQRVLSRNKLD